MSQKKVDAYKQEKANRKEILKKEKRMLMIEKVIGLVVCMAAVCWVGYSVYDKVTDTSGKEVVKVDTVIDTSSLEDYAASLEASVEEPEEETAEEVSDSETTTAEEKTESDTENEPAAEAETDTAAEAETSSETDTAAEAETSSETETAAEAVTSESETDKK